MVGNERYVGYAGVLHHDAGMTILDCDGNIQFASMAERYTGVKHDRTIPRTMWKRIQTNDILVQQEDWSDRMSFRGVAAPNLLEVRHKNWWHDHPMVHPSEQVGHHKSHAAAALYTRPWESIEDTVIVTCDGAGEYQCMTIQDHNFNILEQHTYPFSLGFLWAAFTNMIGLTANEDEYVVMGLASYGQPIMGERLIDMFYSIEEFPTRNGFTPKQIEKFKSGTFKKICEKLLSVCSKEDGAASLQYLTNYYFTEDVMKTARKHGSKLAYSGGVAQNIVTNTLIKDMFDDVWIDVNPGDGGASLGAAAHAYCRTTGKDRINWQHPYHGYDITGKVNPKKVVDHILDKKICGIANGPAEFSYRAYGNRSLIADVRYDIKDTVNDIKQRQRFRPFAPAILEEHADQYFSGHMNQYMQYAATALHDYSSVTHVDGTARVQLVNKDCPSVFRQVLEEYYDRTGVPMLLNTSLNIRGQPMVNNELDARLFEEKYGVKVF